MRFTAVSVVPSGNYLLFAVGSNYLSESYDSAIGVHATSEANFIEHSSMKINYRIGTVDHSPRYEKILTFETKSKEIKSTSYEIMIGGRTQYDDEDTKDVYLFYYGTFHGSNKTIELTSYFVFNQGTLTPTVAFEPNLDAYSESGILELLEDPTSVKNAVSLVRFSEGDGTNRKYEVILMSFKRDFTQMNWLTKFRDNYQAEALFYDSKIYLLLTKNADLYLQIINPTDGIASKKVYFTINGNEKMFYPQMAVSKKIASLFIVHKVDKIAVSPVPAEMNKIRVSLFDTTNLTLSSNSFTFTQTGSPLSIDAIQTSGKEQVIMKGILDTGANDVDKRFTFSVYPVLNTQDLGT